MNSRFRSRNRPSRDSTRLFLPVAAGVLLTLFTGTVAAASNHGSAFMDMSLEDLVNIRVVSVTMKSAPLSETAAAVYVITEEDIRRSGARLIPEILRMVPGVQVGRIDANKWAVSARGFNDRFANKMLVLVDGRSVYSPLFSGVYWDNLNVPIENIDRIEVIRGPGGSLWGANAVNGVVNIVQKSAAPVREGRVSAGTGNEEDGYAAATAAGALGAGGAWRASGRFLKNGGLGDASGRIDDSWNAFGGGMRYDRVEEGKRLTLDAGFSAGSGRNRLESPIDTPPFTKEIDVPSEGKSGNLMVRWETIRNDRILRLQGWVDHHVQTNQPILDERRTTVNLETFHARTIGRNALSLGAGIRRTADDMSEGEIARIEPAARTDYLVSAFIQDEISVMDDRLRLTPGTKIEHNDYTGAEIQPSARLWFGASRSISAWAAVARAVRTPSRAESDVRLTHYFAPPGTFGADTPGTEIIAVGNPFMQSEVLVAWEAGVRGRLSQRFGFDVAAFHNDYSRLRTITALKPYPKGDPEGTLVMPFTAVNDMEGASRGLETSLDFRAGQRVRLRLNYSFLDADFRLKPWSIDTTSLRYADSAPRHQVWTGLFWDVTRRVSLDLAIRSASGIPNLEIGAYTVLDLRCAVRPAGGLELALIGSNLGNGKHREFQSQFLSSQSVEIGPQVFGTVTWTTH